MFAWLRRNCSCCFIPLGRRRCNKSISSSTVKSKILNKDTKTDKKNDKKNDKKYDKKNDKKNENKTCGHCFYKHHKYRTIE